MDQVHLMAALAEVSEPKTAEQKIAIAYADALCFPRYNRGKPISNKRIRDCLSALRHAYGVKTGGIGAH